MNGKENGKGRGKKKRERTLYYFSGNKKGYKWNRIGEKETHPVYKGEVENGVPNGLGILIFPLGKKYVGSWKNGKYHGEGTITYSSGTKYVGEFKDDFISNGTLYDKDGNIYWKFVNGKVIKQ